MIRSRAFAAAAAASLGLLFAVTSAAGEESAAEKVAAGRSFALKVCWTCHIVAKNQPRKPILSQPAPSFSVIAQRPDLTESSLRRFLGSHNETMGRNGRMPNPRLVDYQIDELTAYIMSLKK